MSKAIFLFSLILTITLSQHTYFGSYGKKSKCCGIGRSAENNKLVNWENNYVCNGDFEKPELPKDKTYAYYNNIPCW